MDSNDDLSKVLHALSNAVKEISEEIHTVDLEKVGTHNKSGEEQIALDVLSDRILQKHLLETGLIAGIGSEEMEDVLRLNGGKYTVVYDPMDGSSLVDVNLAVGTIFGIYEGNELIGRTGREMVAAGFSVYGPRTTMMISRGDGLKEYRLTPCKEGDAFCRREWQLIKFEFNVGPGKMFAPGNLRATSDRVDYLKLVEWWVSEQYTLRYSGGMVPDINQILLKGKGVFSYPGYSKAPNGKLRLLFECAPMAYVMEQAGGAASDGSIPILDKKIEEIHQRTPIYLGSKEEVKRCEEYLGGP